MVLTIEQSNSLEKSKSHLQLMVLFGISQTCHLNQIDSA